MPAPEFGATLHHPRCAGGAGLRFAVMLPPTTPAHAAEEGLRLSMMPPATTPAVRVVRARAVL